MYFHGFTQLMIYIKQVLLSFSLLLTAALSAQQEITYRWSFYDIQNVEGKSLLPIDSSDYFSISENGKFEYSLKAKNNLFAQGLWEIHGDTLSFHYILPSDTTRHYLVKTLNDTSLVINEGSINFIFSKPTPTENSKTPLPLNYDFGSGGISLTSLARGILGLSTLLFISFLMSSKRRQINWPLILKGLFIQLIIAVAILKVPIIRIAFDWISEKFVILLSFTREGSEFLFGGLISNTESFGYIFAFQVLPTVIFFSAITSLLFYYGILQKLVFAFAWVMKRTMKLSGAESLAAAGNIFLGQTESPLLVKPYIGKMTMSELLCLMSGGMATIAGGVLAAYIGFLGGEDVGQQIFFAKHLLAASVMSAPAAVVAAKILLPETDTVNEKMQIEKGDIGTNALEAITNGTTQGLKLAVNVGAMLLVFIAVIAMANYIFQDVIGEFTGLNQWVAATTNNQYSGFSLQFILGYTLAPLTWVMGVNSQDMVLVGQLLGEKTILNEFMAYVSLTDLMAEGKFSSEKSIVIATYILCGFSNFSSIGIQIGGIGVLAPSRKKDLSKLGFQSLIAGTLACLFTAVIVGMLI